MGSAKALAGSAWLVTVDPSELHIHPALNVCKSEHQGPSAAASLRVKGNDVRIAHAVALPGMQGTS